MHWKDHFFVSDNISLAEVKERLAKPVIRKTKGNYVAQDRNTIAIASTEDDDGTWAETNFILKKDIVWRSDKDGTG